MSEFERVIAWVLYSAIEEYRQKLMEDFSHDGWYDWIQSIRIAKRTLIKGVE